MHAGQLIVLSLLLPTPPQDMPLQAPPSRPSATAPVYGAPSVRTQTTGSGSIRISAEQDYGQGEPSRTMQDGPPSISPTYSNSQQAAPPSRLSDLTQGSAPARDMTNRSGGDEAVYRLLTAEQGNGSGSQSNTMPPARPGNSVQAGNPPLPGSRTGGSGGANLILGTNQSGNSPSGSGAAGQRGLNQQQIRMSNGNSLQAPNLPPNQGSTYQQPGTVNGRQSLPAGTGADSTRYQMQDTSAPRMPNSEYQGVPTGSSGSPNYGERKNAYPIQNTRPSWPNEQTESTADAQYPSIDDSNTGTATQYLRSAMFGVAYGVDGLDGKPMRLEEVLSLSRGADERLRACQAYWQLAVAVADYHFAMDELQWLRDLSSPQSRLDQSYLGAAIAGAEARYRETRLAVLSRQYELTEASSVLSRHDLPLPLDAPFIGRYRTRFELYASRRSMPSGLAKIDRALPLMLELISTRAKATAASQLAMKEARDGYVQGAIGVNEVVDRFVRTRDQRLALLGAVRDYNYLIAEYAFAVQPSQSQPSDVVAMLIDPKDRANSQLEELDPTFRQATRPTDRSRNPNSNNVPPPRR